MSKTSTILSFTNHLTVVLTSLLLTIVGHAQTTPFQLTDPGFTGQNLNWNYNMGYRFTPNSDGEVTHLGGRWTDGVSHTVRLYSYPAGTVLASISVTGSSNWAYEELGSPVSLTGGSTYVVAVRLDGQSSGAYTTFSMPVTTGGIEILGSSYRSGSNAMPTNLITTNMYGQADIVFEPCAYAGSLTADDEELISGGSTNITVTENVGNIQWQSSENNESWADLVGESGPVLNTGALDTTTYFRTYVTSGGCAGDTSAVTTISVIDPFNPLKAVNPTLSGTNNNWNYNMGYRFQPLQNGDVAQLGGRWAAGVTHTVRLYEYPAGTVLASVAVTGTGEFAYEDITPVSLTVGNTYVIAVRLDSQSSGYYATMSMPVSSAGVQILNASYVSGSNAMPTNSITTTMYGMADFRFDPCSFAGLLVADDATVARYDSTTITNVGAVGDIQWQLSTNNINWTNIAGATTESINTSVLNATSYFRTYVTGGSCGPDTSDVVTVKVVDPSRPLQYAGLDPASANNNWNYNMGYRFTSDVNGNITELGGRWKTDVDHTVRLYRVSDQAVLASATVTGNEEWAYNAITPVAITAGTEYFVAVRLDGQSSGYTTSMTMPTTSAQINILNSGYVSASNAMPTNSVTTTMYGEADFKFEPCVYAGTVEVTDATVCPLGSTTLEVNEYVGNIQWQSSLDNVSFANIPGETDSILNTGALSVKTYFRAMISDVCGSDSTTADSVSVVGAGGTPGLWTALNGTDWSDACNWDDGVVPTTGDAVTIPWGVDAPTNIPEISLSYLKIDNVNGITLTENFYITDSIYLKVGKLNMGTDTLFLDEDAYFVGGYSTSYVVVDGGGAVVKSYSVADGSTFTFPVGDVNDFVPIDIDLNVGSTLGASAAIAIQTVDAKQPLVGSPNAYITRYWSIVGIDITTPDYDISARYTNDDVVGTEASMFGVYFDGSLWNYGNVPDVVNNIISLNGATIFADFTAASEFPYLSTGNGIWGDNGSWNLGSIPLVASDAVIVTGDTITLNADQQIDALDINTGAVLDLNGNTLTLTSHLVTDGDIIGDGTILMNGITEQYINSSDQGEFFDLEIDNAAGVTIQSGEQWLSGTLYLTSGTLNSNGYLTLVSDENGTARVDEITGGAITGDVNVQRYVAGPNNGWLMIGPCITGATLADFTADFVTTGFPGSNYPSYGFVSISVYDETALGAGGIGWGAPSNISDPVYPGKGLFVYQGALPRAFTYTGTLATGVVDLGVTYTDDPGQPATEDGWQAAANPYPSTIDWDAAGWTKSNVNDAIYIWDAQAQNYATYISGVGANGGSRYIASGQAFYVQTNGASPQLIANESVKVANTATFFKKAAVPDPILKLKLSDTQGYSDEAIFRVTEESTAQYDDKKDALKFFSSSASIPQLFTVHGGDQYSINSIPQFADADSFLVHIKVAAAGDYTLGIAIADFPEDACIQLTDLATETTTLVSNGSSFEFTADAAYEGPRFKIGMNAPKTVSVVEATCEAATNGWATVQPTGSGLSTITWMNATGDILAENMANTVDTLSQLAPGDYMVELADQSNCPTSTQYFTVEVGDGLDIDFIASSYEVEPFTVVEFESAGEGLSLSWDFDNELTAEGAMASTQFETPGTYNVSLTATDGACVAEITQPILVLEPVITALPRTDASSAPKVWMDGQQQLNLQWSAEVTFESILVYNISGQLVYQQSIHGANSAQVQSAQSFQSGVYIVVLEGTTSSHATRIEIIK